MLLTEYDGSFVNGGYATKDWANFTTPVSVGIITPTLPDLVITAVTGPRSVVTGNQIDLYHSVKNSGNGPAGPFSVGFYLSSNSTISTSDLLIVSCTYTNGLSAGQTNDCSGPITLPASTPTGVYFLGAIADYKNEVSESNETNNTRIADSGTVTVTSAQNTNLLSKRGGIDIDGDGKGEIIVRSASASLLAGRLINNQFQFTTITGPSTSYRLVGVGDFDGNGRSDLAFQNMTQGTFGDVRIWPNFTSSGEILLRQVKQVWDVQAVGDLDGDGYGDLVWRYVVPNSPDTGVSYIWFSNGGSVTQIRKRGGAPLDWQLLGAMDLNSDGAADMVYLGPQNQLKVLMATSNRTCANFDGGSIATNFTALKLGNFTYPGGGVAEVLSRDRATGTVRITTLMLSPSQVLPAYSGLPDDPNASCTSSSLVVPQVNVRDMASDPTWQFYASDDFNGDGITDIVWLKPNGTLTVWLMNANGAAPTVILNAGTAPAGHTVFQNGGPAVIPTGQTSTKAEGTYSGTTSSGYTFESVILENDQLWTLYGLPSNINNELLVLGMVQGNGTSNSGSFTAPNTKDFWSNGTVVTGTITATYTPGVSFNGIFSGATFNGTTLPQSSYVYDAPAVLSTITGSWYGSLLDGSPSNIGISSAGVVTGSSLGCTFSGTVAPRGSGKNIFNVSITFGSSGCLLPGQSVSGIGISNLVSGNRRQLIVGLVNAARTNGVTFISTR